MRGLTLLLAAGLLFAAGWGARMLAEPELPADRTDPADPPDAGPSLEDAPRLRASTQADATRPADAASVVGDADAHAGLVDGGITGPGGSDEDVTDLVAARDLITQLERLMQRAAQDPRGTWAELERLASDRRNDWVYGSSASSAAARQLWTRFQARHAASISAFLVRAFELLGTERLDPEVHSEMGLELLAEEPGAALIAELDDRSFRALRTRLRGYVSDPAALLQREGSGFRRMSERILIAWTASTSAAEARRELRAGRPSPVEAVALLDRLAPEDVPSHKPAQLLARMLRERGAWDRFKRSIHWLYPDGDEPSAADLQMVDEAVLALALRTEHVDFGRELWRYLQATRRAGWPAAEPFVDRGLALGGKALEHISRLLPRLKPRPPAFAIQQILDTHKLPPHIRRILEPLAGARKPTR